ncbi:MAG: hypothetical protein DLM67_17115 [Candidatus Nephthysia bennettiae]|uniref:Uncharacterized protein n=1 Tax=Candidatus Nephthysia bennettiae TaxID=3127016 RepID=A0A934KBL1_9BACT|nr:hypothetical protein [Candidatus Dormibacteraeota bacterium]MBJ7612825.1 hypothetical protein [Candidatus Dormibacteraeota bacterium]PZR90915.1 MAG: hypothetical protein DLM67_17115 [Candidatus Dormibacteraeota bacterium]
MYKTVALVSGLILLAFVVVGFVLAVTVLPAGGHQLGGLLLGDTDLGRPGWRWPSSPPASGSRSRGEIGGPVSEPWW